MGRRFASALIFLIVIAGGSVLYADDSVRLMVGRSTVVSVGTPIARVSLTSPDVADALVTAPNELLINGKTPGTISMGTYAAITFLPGFLASREMDRRLKDVSGVRTSAEDAAEEGTVVRVEKAGPLPILDKIVSSSNFGGRLKHLIEQSGVKTTPSAIVMPPSSSQPARSSKARSTSAIAFTLPRSPRPRAQPSAGPFPHNEKSQRSILNSQES